MKIINCTPHAVHILDFACTQYNPVHKGFDLIGTKTILHEFPPSGIVPRCLTKERNEEPINGVPIASIEFGNIDGLPDEEPDTMLIVSAIVANAGRAKGRKDLLVPTRMVRDSEGRICGCLVLAI